MKAEDLMVGDWVKPLREKLKGTPGKVVTPDGGCNICWIDCEEYSCLVPCDELEPIPLTPEILEKNGFSGEGYNMGVIGFHTDPIPEVKDGYEVFIWKDMCLEIKHGFTHLKRYTFYVHELQHCLKLCGINLEITV